MRILDKKLPTYNFNQHVKYWGEKCQISQRLMNSSSAQEFTTNSINFLLNTFC